MLYGLFQKFITFDDIFRGTLWAEVDLEAATREVGFTIAIFIKKYAVSKKFIISVYHYCV